MDVQPQTVAQRSQWRATAQPPIEQLYARSAGRGVFNGLLGSVCAWSETLSLIGEMAF